MAPIHRRAAEKGPGFDGVPGLEHKAFLVSDASIGQPNLYAPFYIWRSASGMRDFLLSDGFAALSEAFGRPEVVTWTVLRFRRFDTSRAPSFATQETTSIAPGARARSLCEQARDAAGAHVGLHSSLVAIDPQRWALTRVLLWHTRPAPAPGIDAWHVPYLATRR
jgi:hypothetical protein